MSIKPGYLFHSENFALSQAGSLSEPFSAGDRTLPIPEPASETTTAAGHPGKTSSSKLALPPSAPNHLTELNRLKELLRRTGTEDPNQCHTDNVGSEEDNQVLSENRAKLFMIFWWKRDRYGNGCGSRVWGKQAHRQQ